MSSEDNCYVSHDKDNRFIRIGNEKIERVFYYDVEKEKFFTSQLKNKATGENWSVSESREFCISIKKEDQTIDIGNCYEEPQGGLNFERYTVEELQDGGKRLKVAIQSAC